MAEAFPRLKPMAFGAPMQLKCIFSHLVFPEISNIINPPQFQANPDKSGGGNIKGKKGGSAMKALVVDDDFDVRMLYSRVLSGIAECETVDSGEEACKSVSVALDAHAPFNLILLDIMMPGIDGLEALRKIRMIESEKGILPGNGSKVIMVSGISNSKYVLRAFQDQCEAYLIKPFKMNCLFETMKGLGFPVSQAQRT